MTTNHGKITSKAFFLLFSTTLLFSSCKNSESSDSDLSDDLHYTDTVKAVNLNVDGELFSIPSPIQSAQLIKRTGIKYNKAILNTAQKNQQYLTYYSRALNLGIYGADLGYISLYNQTQDALAYLAAIKNISDKLGVTHAFDQNSIKRISNNLSNKDSTLVLVGIAYRAIDMYLKTNDRAEISSLILTGGWIESMHFSISSYTKKPTEELKYRIADQKAALKSIIKLITSHNLPEAADLLEQLKELSTIYENISFKYNYIEPTTFADKKTTYINSTTDIQITDIQIKNIASKITTIRDAIINSRP